MSASTEVIAGICSDQWTDAEAAERLQAVCARDRAIDVALLAHVRTECPQWTGRALKILSQVAVSQRIAPALMPLLSSADAAIRAQSAFLMARARPNRVWVAAMLEHSDDRVRANVVEGIRGSCSDLTLIETALQDRAPRVRANAMLLLYDLRPEEAFGRLEQMLQSADWRYRSSACWACGATGNWEAVALVQPLRTDEHANVRWNALRALSALYRASQKTEDLS